MFLSAARTPAAIERRQRCKWEGNARELENLIERALALVEGPEIGPDDLPIEGPSGPAPEAAGDDPNRLLDDALARHLTLAELSDLYIDRGLAHTRGNMVRAAGILGIIRRTLYRRGERKGAAEDDEEEPTT